VARGLRGRDELAWRDRLLGDLDNLRSAVVWALDTGVEEDQQTAVAIVAWLAYESQALAMGIGRWAEQALPALERSTPGYRHAVLAAAAVAAFYRGDFDASERYAGAALEEGYSPDDPSPCLASIYLMIILMYQGRSEDGARHLDAAEKAILRRDNEEYLRSWLQSAPVGDSLFADDPDQEIAQARLGISLAQRTGNPTILALASYALGWALRHRHPDEALAALDQSVALARRGASSIALANALGHGAQVAALLGDTDGAKARLKDALEESLRMTTGPSSRRAWTPQSKASRTGARPGPPPSSPARSKPPWRHCGSPTFPAAGPAWPCGPPIWPEPGNNWETAATSRPAPRAPP
jgi:hypothetical protein